MMHISMNIFEYKEYAMLILWVVGTLIISIIITLIVLASYNKDYDEMEPWFNILLTVFLVAIGIGIFIYQVRLENQGYDTFESKFIMADKFLIYIWPTLIFVGIIQFIYKKITGKDILFLLSKKDISKEDKDDNL